MTAWLLHAAPVRSLGDSASFLPCQIYAPQDKVAMASSLLLQGMRFEDVAPLKAAEMFQAAAEGYVQGEKWRSAAYALRKTCEIMKNLGQQKRIENLERKIRFYETL